MHISQCECTIYTGLLNALYVCERNTNFCKQVNRMWRWLCTHPLLWQRLAALPAWRLAADSHRAQIAKHSLNSIVNWKEVTQLN